MFTFISSWLGYLRWRLTTRRSHSEVIYIAGPLSAPTLREERDNVDKVIEVAIDLIGKGHRPHIPHFTYFVASHPKWFLPSSYEFWVEWFDKHVLWRCCDSLYLIAGSTGANMEVAWAQQFGKRIYTSMREVPDASGEFEFIRALSGTRLHRWLKDRTYDYALRQELKRDLNQIHLLTNRIRNEYQADLEPYLEQMYEIGLQSGRVGVRPSEFVKYLQETNG